MKYCDLCKHSLKYYKDTLTNTYGIGNVNLTFQDIILAEIEINRELVNETKRFLITPFHTPKVLNLNTLRLMGYETISY